MNIEKQYIQDLLCSIDNRSDREKHMIADTILCNLLEELGFVELIAEYKKINKSY